MDTFDTSNVPKKKRQRTEPAEPTEAKGDDLLRTTQLVQKLAQQLTETADGLCYVTVAPWRSQPSHDLDKNTKALKRYSPEELRALEVLGQMMNQKKISCADDDSYWCPMNADVGLVLDDEGKIVVVFGH